MLSKDFHTRMEARGWSLHWEGLRDDLDALEETTVQNSAKTFFVPTRTVGNAGKAFQALGGPSDQRSGSAKRTPPPSQKSGRKADVVPGAKMENTIICRTESYKIIL